jgi:MFS family permease
MAPGLEKPTHVRYWVVVFALTLAVITYIDRVSLSYAALSVRHDLHLNEVQMGWAWGAFACAYALFEMPGGYLGDWLGPRSVLLRVVVWWSFFTFATGWTWGFGSLVVTQFLFGAGEAGCFPNLTKAFTTWLPGPEKVRAQSLMWMTARWGGAFTPPLVWLVMGHIGWRHTFQLFGLVGVAWAVLFALWYKNDPLDNPKLNQAERRLLRETATLASGHGDVPWGRFLFSRQVWMLCWQYFALSWGWYFYITWLPTYLREGRHVEGLSTAMLSILPLFCGGLGNPTSAAIGTRLARWNGNLAKTRRIMAICGFSGAAALLLLSTRVHNPTLAVLVIAMASFSNDLVMPNAWGAAMDVGGKYAGTLSGTMNMWGNLAGLLAPVATGYLLRGSGGNWNLTFYVSASIYLTGVVFWALLDPVTPIDKRP